MGHGLLFGGPERVSLQRHRQPGSNACSRLSDHERTFVVNGFYEQMFACRPIIG
jgi:hypothetical protein